MTAEEAHEIVEAFKIENPEAYSLAEIVSLAVRIEPEYIRVARLNLLRGVHAGAESDLWFSPLVQSQTPMALEFFPEVVEILRANLAANQALLQQAWNELKSFHRNAPFALRLEEELTWLGLATENNQEQIENHLESVLVTLKKEARIGLAQWAKRALPTLPEKARATDAARRLSLVAGIQTGVGPVLSEMPSRGLSQAWFTQFIAKKLEPVPVGVRLLKKRPQPINGDVGSATPEGAIPDSAKAETLPMIVEFSYPPASNSGHIEVPDTYRLLLEVSWQGQSRNYVRQVSLLPQEIQRVEVGYGEVRIRTALGAAYTLGLHFDYDFIILYNQADEELATRLTERLEQQEWRGERLKVNRFIIDPNVLSASEAEASDATVSSGRKVGFIISEASKGELPILQAMIPLRPEPQSNRDWSLSILTTDYIGMPFIGDNQVVDFVRRDQFEEGYRALWTAITGEYLPAPVKSPEPAGDRENAPVNVVALYAHKDERLYDQLTKHLKLLERQDLIKLRSDSEIGSGDDWAATIKDSLEQAEIILLLISADFLASDFLYDVVMKRALDRHEAGEARIIPIILRPCDWQSTPLANFQVLPQDGKPVTTWSARDSVFINIIRGIRQVVEDVRKEKGASANIKYLPRPPAMGFIHRRGLNGQNIVAQLMEELTPGKRGLVALSGAGGVGKTTLAAEAVRRLASRYERRVVWISADGRPDFTLQILLDEVATQLGEPEMRKLALEPKKEAVQALIAAGAATLIVLDNFETVSPEEQQHCAEWITKSAPCAVLITSRERVNGARNISIGGMPPAEANEFLERLIAQAHNPRAFAGIDRARIIQATEANPLVMLWVIVQIELAEHPNDVLDALAQGKGAAVERVFEHSFTLPQLGNDGRDALFALSLFTPSASHVALAEVAGFGEDVSRLREATKRLAALGLIGTTEAGERLMTEGLTRGLAKARLSNDERALAFRRRFVSCFMRYAQSHAELTTADFDALEAEKDNLLNAVDIAFDLAYWESVLNIVSVMAQPAGMLDMRGYMDQAIECSARALEAARRLNSDQQIAVYAYNLSSLRASRGEIEEAEQLSEEALQISQRLGDLAGLSTVMRQLASLKLYQADLGRARELYNESLEISRRLNDSQSIAATLHDLGKLAQQGSDAEQAMHLYNESLKIFEGLGDHLSIAAVLSDLGLLFQQQQRPQEARRNFEQSLEINKKLEDRIGIARNLQQLGRLAANEKERKEAQQRFEDALAIYRQLGHQEGTAGSLYDMGMLRAQQGDVPEARRLIRESLNILERLQSPSAQRVRAMLNDLETSDAQ